MQCVRRELDEHLKSDFEAHGTMVVQALTLGATVIADKESRLDSRLTELQERVDGIVFMYESPLHWRVEGWTNTYRKAKAGAVPFINSPFVATGRNGYRFYLRVYPFGHDSGTW